LKLNLTEKVSSFFPQFERSGFPEALCTHQNSREPEVFDADQDFVCVLADSRFPSELRLKVLRPYVWRGNDFETGEFLTRWGWTDGDNVFDHWENNINDDYEFVVAWEKA
jgi:hypothetical protein